MRESEISSPSHPPRWRLFIFTLAVSWGTSKQRRKTENSLKMIIVYNLRTGWLVGLICHLILILITTFEVFGIRQQLFYLFALFILLFEVNQGAVKVNSPGG